MNHVKHLFYAIILFFTIYTLGWGWLIFIEWEMYDYWPDQDMEPGRFAIFCLAIMCVVMTKDHAHQQGEA